MRRKSGDGPLLPRVYAVGEAEPQGSNFNLLPLRGPLSPSVVRKLDEVRKANPIVDLLYVAVNRQIAANEAARSNGSTSPPPNEP